MGFWISVDKEELTDSFIEIGLKEGLLERMDVLPDEVRAKMPKELIEVRNKEYYDVYFKVLNSFPINFDRFREIAWERNRLLDFSNRDTGKIGVRKCHDMADIAELEQLANKVRQLTKQAFKATKH